MRSLTPIARPTASAISSGRADRAGRRERIHVRGQVSPESPSVAVTSRTRTNSWSESDQASRRCRRRRSRVRRRRNSLAPAVRATKTDRARVAILEPMSAIALKLASTRIRRRRRRAAARVLSTRGGPTPSLGPDILSSSLGDAIHKRGTPPLASRGDAVSSSEALHERLQRSIERGVRRLLGAGAPAADVAATGAASRARHVGASDRVERRRPSRSSSSQERLASG